MTRALILRAPGINCDRETAQACRLVGFDTDLVHINQLIKHPESLLNYHFLVIPGGFSYGDDLGAGTLLAKNLTVHLDTQLRRFINEGRPVLGICNGFQVLVRAGLLPGQFLSDNAQEGTTRATLTDNVSAQFECRWVTLAARLGPCIFTRGIDHPIELPVAHGEGRFVFNGDLDQLQAGGQIALIYSSEAGAAREKVLYPANPNGSVGGIAGICNARGNVFGLMPHPERYVHSLQHPQRQTTTDGQGDGILIFKNAYDYATELSDTVPPQKTRSKSSGRKSSSKTGSAYANSGVDIAAAERAKRLMQDAVRSTHGAEVLAGMGAFAGIYSAQSVQKMQHPAFVSSTDGVGTKTLLASQVRRFDTIGFDLVNHSVNDLLTQGARPLFFMDYLAMGRLDAVQAAKIVRSVADACQEVGCALLGGETAEMPDVYQPGAFDLAGTIVGVVEQEEVIDGRTICAGDVLVGLPSSGLHTNGYSLARQVFASYDLNTVFPELGEPLVDALLRPHRSYLREINALRSYLADRKRYIKGIAHITGGGFEGNISRILPKGTQAIIETNSWQVPPLFALLAKLGNIEHDELYRAFNMGVGMVLVLSPKGALDARCILPNLLTIGHIKEGKGVRLH
jgi:phosphoribosylformylglycinamidine cyclo-ligase